MQFSGKLADDIFSYLGNGIKPRTIPPLVGRNAQFDDILHHLDLMNNIENLLYANFRFYSFWGTFRLTVFNYMKKGADNIIEQCIQLMETKKLDQQLTLARPVGTNAPLGFLSLCPVQGENTVLPYSAVYVSRVCRKPASC